MSVTISENFTQRHYTWSNWKLVQSLKELVYQYDDDGITYIIWGYDGPEVHMCKIWKGTVPSSLVSAYSQSQNNSDKSDFETNYLPYANKSISDTDGIRRKLVEVNFRKDNITNTSSYLLIDLNNSSNAYKHNSGTILKMAGIHGVVIKDTATDQWVITVGVVLSINGSNANIGWLRFGTQNVRDTGIFQHEIALTIFPFLSNLTVKNGDFVSIADNYKETLNSITTSTSIEDISGGSTVPEVGDLILKTNKILGTGSLLLHYHLWYIVE